MYANYVVQDVPGFQSRYLSNRRGNNVTPNVTGVTELTNLISNVISDRIRSCVVVNVARTIDEAGCGLCTL